MKLVPQYKPLLVALLIPGNTMSLKVAMSKNKHSLTSKTNRIDLVK